MEDHEKGREAFENDDAYRLHCLRHSTAHIMAQAITKLHPEVKLGIGPAIEDGFYYDVDVAHPIGEQELAAIEAEMKRVVKENQTFEREEWSIEQAMAFFGERGQVYKTELIQGFGDPTVSIYKNTSKEGETFVDLCKGPHILRTGQAKHFKLQKVSGAYWRGDAARSQLQRIYGTVFATKEELEQHLFRLEEAKKRDHRKLGKELDLFMFHDWAPGAPFWLPRGEHIYTTLANQMRSLLTSEGYVAVKTPLVFDKKLWETSGHWTHYVQNMFHFPEESHKEPSTAHGHDHGHDHGHSHSHEGVDAESLDARVFALKAMNCPSHMLIFRSKKRSYRDLPIRIHDQGVLHRNELSGALSGLTRVRQFSQDDAHIFCMEEQIGDEVGRLLDLINRIYPAFDLGFHVKLSTRPEQKLGDDELWDRAEKALSHALESRDIPFKINAGDGAFYGPKIDFDVVDAIGRPFQCATIQLDFQLPRRFDLSYVGADNALHTPVVIHRAIFGSFERFIGILIEHYAGNFPVWFAPEQVRVLTVSEKSVDYGQGIYAALKSAGFQVTIDDSDDKVGYKVRVAASMKVPYIVVVGERDAQEATVSVRARGNLDLGSMALDAFIEKLASEARAPF